MMRGMQRQPLSSRSSMASPLALSDNNGTKPLWSLSSKLQLRSNSPSRFSLDSHSSSPTLERIGEAVDDRVSGGGKASLVTTSESGAGPRRRLVEQLGQLKVGSTAAAETWSSKQAGENNNLTPRMEPLTPGPVSPAKDKQRSGDGESSGGNKRAAAKTSVESQEKSPKKRPATSSTSSSSPSRAAPDKSPSRTQAKGGSVASHPKTKGEGPCKSLKTASSKTATPSKKSSSQTQETLRVESAQPKKSGAAGSQSSQPHKRPSPRGGAERSSASARTKGEERSTGRDSPRVPVVERKATPRSGAATASRDIGSAGGGKVEGRAGGRSSSSSSSITSLRSSSVGLPPASAAPPPRGPRRNSRTEDKGLSFFKSALRQKESRRGAGGTEARSPDETSRDAADEASSEGASKSGSAEASAKDSESSKSGTSAAAKRSLLTSNKTKSSAAGTAAQPLANGKEAAKKEAAKKEAAKKETTKKETTKKTMPSRKIPITATRTSQKPK